MAKKPEPPPKPAKWTIYKIAANAVRLDAVDAPDSATAIERASFGQRSSRPAYRLFKVIRAPYPNVKG
jgi:hypothetical protein